jgi:hypothetical protein
MRNVRRTAQSNASPGSDARVDVGRHEARQLWQLLDDVVELTTAPPVETLALDGSLAVTCGQARSRGVVGRSEAAVTLGLPLLEAVPTSEVRALLALELAGIGRRRGARHGRDANAVSAAAEIAGAVVVAAALVRAELVRRVLDEDYWPAVFHGARSASHPHVKPFTLVRRTLRAHVEAGALRAQAGRLFGVDSVDASEPDGPSLTERLRTLGVSPLEALDAALLPVAAPAAELLGPAYESLLARLDDGWAERVDEWWEHAHEEALRETLGAGATPARTWTQATALARYSETLRQTPTR